MARLSRTLLSGLLMTLAAACWGASFVWIKTGVRTISPVTLAALRYSLASAVLLAVVLPNRKIRRQAFSLALWKTFLLIGFVGTFLPNLLQNYGMVYLNAGISSVIQGAGPVYTSLLAAAVLSERFGLRKAVGAVLAISGTGLLSLGSGSNGAHVGSVIGVVLVTLSALSYSVYTVMMRRSLLNLVNPVSLLAGTFSAGTIQLLAAALILDRSLGLPNMGVPEAKLVMALSLISTLVAYLCYVAALGRMEASKVSYFIFLVPVFGLVFSWLFLNEALNLFQGTVSILILGGVLLAQTEDSSSQSLA